MDDNYVATNSKTFSIITVIVGSLYANGHSCFTRKSKMCLYLSGNQLLVCCVKSILFPVCSHELVCPNPVMMSMNWPSNMGMSALVLGHTPALLVRGCLISLCLPVIFFVAFEMKLFALPAFGILWC